MSAQMRRRDLIRTFGRTRRRKLSARQQWLVDNLLPKLAPTEKDADGAILEIGFGTGEHIVELAGQNTDKTIIGAEPFINGVASLLSKITDENNAVKPQYKNIRIWPDDIQKLMPRIAFHISQAYILHPDPWPKARHEKRRLLNADFLETLSSFISKDGSIIIGTDHMDYYDWVLEQISRTNLEIKTTDVDTIKTRYQEKNMFGGGTMYIALSGAYGAKQ
ncbi:MAG: tRNA (guanine(46)-N(7))-methyltransferase TrmB [Rickettsiales bacterium]|nr:tRNA (guanine(46)-N(7))-methyltransferase TrmB [Rickettsiales bacterium]